MELNVHTTDLEGFYAIEQKYAYENALKINVVKVP